MEEWHPQLKLGNVKFASTSFSQIITLCYASAKIDFYPQFFKKLFKTATPANKGEYDVKGD